MGLVPWRFARQCCYHKHMDPATFRLSLMHLFCHATLQHDSERASTVAQNSNSRKRRKRWSHSTLRQGRAEVHFVRTNSFPPTSPSLFSTASTTYFFGTMKTFLTLLLSVCCSFVHGARYGLLRVSNLPGERTRTESKPSISDVNSALFEDDVQR